MTCFLAPSAADEQLRDRLALAAALKDLGTIESSDTIFALAFAASRAIGVQQSVLLMRATLTLEHARSVLEAASGLRRPLMKGGPGIDHVVTAFLECPQHLMVLPGSLSSAGSTAILRVADSEREPKFLPRQLYRILLALPTSATPDEAIGALLEQKRARIRSIVCAPDYPIRRRLKLLEGYSASEYEALFEQAKNAGLSLETLAVLAAAALTFRNFKLAISHTIVELYLSDLAAAVSTANGRSHRG